MCTDEGNGFFSKDNFFNKGFPSLASYDQHFATRSELTLKGEVCVDYLFRPTCMSRLSIYNPEIKIIAVLRNPAERAYSHWQNNVNLGEEDLPFLEAIEREKDALLNSNDDQSTHNRSYLKRGFYSEQIQNLLQYFDPHQILLLKNENLRDDTDVVLYQTCQFLGLPYFEVDKLPRELGNYERSLTNEEYNSLIEYFEKDVMMVEDLINWQCTDWIKPVLSERPMLSYISA